MSQITDHVDHYLAECIKYMVPRCPSKVFVGKVLGSMSSSFRGWIRRQPAQPQFQLSRGQYVATPVDLLKLFIGPTLAGRRAGYTKEIVDEILQRLEPAATRDHGSEQTPASDSNAEAIEEDDQMEVEEESAVITQQTTVARRATVPAVDLVESPVVLNEQQAANIARDVSVSMKYMAAVGKARKLDDGRISVADILTDLIGITTKSANTKITRWAEDKMRIFEKAHYGTTQIPVCEPLELYLFLRKTSVAPWLGITDPPKVFIGNSRVLEPAATENHGSEQTPASGSNAGAIEEDDQMEVDEESAVITQQTVVAHTATVPEVDLVESPVVLNEQQAANVARDVGVSMKYMAAVGKALTLDDGRVSVADVLSDLIGITTDSANTKISRWEKKRHTPFEKLSDGTYICTSIELLQFLSTTSVSTELGLTAIMVNEMIRRLGGDESLHAELQANAAATQGTIMHELARSPEVGSSAVTHAITPSAPRQYLRQASEAYLYIAPGNGFIKIGETTNLLSRNSSLTDCDILYALRIICANATGMAKNLECSLQSAYHMAIMDGKKDYFHLTPLAEELGQPSPDTDLLSWRMFMKAIEFLEHLHVDARHVSLVQRKGRQFIPLSKDEFGGLQAHFEPASSLGTVTPWVFSAASAPVPVEVQVEMLKCQRDIEMEQIKHATQLDVEMEEAKSKTANEGTKTAEFKFLAEQARARAQMAKYAVIQSCIDKGIDLRMLAIVDKI